MKAILLTGPENLVVTELPSRALRSHEIRIKVAASCICGSDLRNLRHPVVLPQVPGHEFSGSVIELGPESSGKLKMGSRVTAFPMMSCMSCPACSSNDFRDCQSKKSLGFQLPGSFAEEVIVDERLAVPLPEGLSYEQGALVEHLCCGYRVAREIQDRQAGAESHIVIIGDGPIALADVQCLCALGFNNITVLGKHSLRLELARPLGAREALTAWVTPVPAIDICVYAAPAEETLEKVIADMKPGGIVFPQTKITSEVILSRMASSGISTGRAFAYLLSDFDEVMTFIERGRLKTENLITTRLALLEVPENYSKFFDKGKHFKILITNE